MKDAKRRKLSSGARDSKKHHQSTEVRDIEKPSLKAPPPPKPPANEESEVQEDEAEEEDDEEGEEESATVDAPSVEEDAPKKTFADLVSSQHPAPTHCL
jgi:hypothetical protein